MVDVFREGLPLSTANTKFPKIVCPEGLQTVVGSGRRKCEGDLALAATILTGEPLPKQRVDWFQHGEDTPSSHRSSVWAFG